MARPKALKYTGTVTEFKDEQGRVIRREADRWFPGVPTEDLDEAAIANLDDATLKNITGGANPLYVEPKAKAPAKQPARKRVRKAPAKPAAEAREPSETEKAESIAAEDAGDA